MKVKESVIWMKFSAALRRSAICAIALGAVLHGATALAQVQITGYLGNFDVRYPASLPNDLEVVIYGDFPTAPSCVIGTWNTNNLLSYQGGPPAGAQWGPASSITQSVNNDPTSPAFGLDCIVIRWSGPPRPALVGRMIHFGVHLRPGCVVHHQEVWWTINGQRVLRPCDPHITWVCTTRGWIITVANPTPFPIYVYGGRHFSPAATLPLPNLNQLNLAMNPAQFGGNWTPVVLPGGPVTCIPPWCRIHIRVFSTTWRPIIFQIAARNVSDQQIPFQPAPGGGPNPNDIDPSGEFGTMFIMTTRATQEFREDISGDGVVGQPDFNMLRSRFGTSSQDLIPPPATP